MKKILLSLMVLALPLTMYAHTTDIVARHFFSYGYEVKTGIGKIGVVGIAELRRFAKSFAEHKGATFQQAQWRL